MSELQIKTESLPERCEICHKADCFDAKRNYCSRCAGLDRPGDAPILQRTAKSPTVTDIELGAFVGLTIGTLIGAIGGAVSFSVQGSVMGAIVGIMGMAPVWMIQGAIVGLLVGKSARITDEADIRAVSKAVAGADPVYESESRFNGLFINRSRTIKSLLIGLIVSLPFWFIFSDNPLADYKTILWALLGLIDGAVIDALCRTRSDRRDDAPYLKNQQME